MAFLGFVGLSRGKWGEEFRYLGCSQGLSSVGPRRGLGKGRSRQVSQGFIPQPHRSCPYAVDHLPETLNCSILTARFSTTGQKVPGLFGNPHSIAFRREPVLLGW